MKIGLICSHGGHLTELSYLMEAFEGNDIFFVTYDSDRTKYLKNRSYLFKNFGEHKIRVLTSLPKMINVFVKEKPDLLVSNGAEIAIPFFYIAKVFGIKTIFIECYTRIENPTWTGRIVYPISDLFLVLWPEMLQKYGDKAKYWGDYYHFCNCRYAFSRI